MCVGDPPWDRPSSPEACYRGCGGASGSWEGFVKGTPDGAYGTHPAVKANAAHYQGQSRVQRRKKKKDHFLSSFFRSKANYSVI